MILYSWLTTLLMKVLMPVLARIPRLAPQLAERPVVRDLGLEIARARAARKHCIVFHCSSAGEYEQAKPLIDRLLARGDTYVQIFFFSRAGLAFARSRGETAACALVPATDSVFAWGHLFTALRPDAVVVVRYELWPGFIDAARQFARIYLIDASRSQSEGFLRRTMLGWFDGIFAVSAADHAFFTENCGVAAARVAAVGDTKYDRVRERALARRADAEAWKSRLGTRRRLIIGSAHPPEAEALVQAMAAFPAWREEWQIVVAPHHVEAEKVASMVATLARAGMEPIRYTSLRGDAQPDLLVLDTMGMLSEVYGACDAAVVGGALTHKIHNVLEPACHGLAMAFGPFYKNSQEAVLLAEAGHAAVVRDGAELARWWQGLSKDGVATTRPRLQGVVAELCGASDRILAVLQVGDHAR